MTSRLLESHMEDSIKNFGVDSMVILKALLNEGDGTDAQADIDFINRVKGFFNNVNNIWRKKQGEFINQESQVAAERQRTIVMISRSTGMGIDKVSSLITRIMNSVPRALNKKGRLLEEAFSHAHKDYIGEDESSGEEIGEDVTYEEVDAALQEAAIYEEA